MDLSPVERLALFLYGCAPGGTNSNNWTIIFNGDIDLSVIMTFASTLSSLFVMPAWFYTLGKLLTDQANIKIPFLRLTSNLLFTIAPCLIGLVLTHFFPKLRQFALKIAKPLSIFSLITKLSLLVYTKYYIFSLIRFRQWLAAFIPWFGEPF